VGGAADRDIGPPHPTLSPRPAGGEGKASGYVNPIADFYLIFGQALREVGAAAVIRARGRRGKRGEAKAGESWWSRPSR